MTALMNAAAMGILFAGHMVMPVTNNRGPIQPLTLLPGIQSCRLSMLSLLIVVACAEFELSVRTHAFLLVTDRLFAQDPGESTWRKTRLGWVDSTKWNRRERIEFERRIELIHPLTFSALLILLSAGTLIWASEEYQWSRLIRQRH